MVIYSSSLWVDFTSLADTKVANPETHTNLKICRDAMNRVFTQGCVAIIN
ncbi:hypothetical protein [Nostoc sp. 'Peltigera membranacea cyanobiont' 210A]|nr:hypothetical protein [Nostoc sp. 'Peltigera membranacea cyanobiont' 210A]